MNNPMLSNINSILQGQTEQTGSVQNYDLSDNTFSNLLDEKIAGLDTEKISQANIIEKLGIPIGLKIEGFDYVPSSVSTDKVEAINTESNLRDDNKFDIKSLVNDVKDTFSPVMDSVLDSTFGMNTETIGNTAKAVKNFWLNQASNFYSIMDKETVNDISELVAKL